ncbi:nitric oxide synthase oxygenase [Paenibacillus sp. SC116]|uniref:nitric oxide synthase oxygenase n=1 Tax=Paenibacillus sp. SC116 TaxID=2968986 RepID=UPI00215AC177|nr:nitric oxide synthase oxygenase [Paenibacillus sp. SC116]MCR8842856.1 nitric oxide synthase oxygenase [Paenibacillus sp. SC116]
MSIIQTNQLRPELQYVWEEAQSFVDSSYPELGHSADRIQQRLGSIITELHETGTYTHTTEELEYGAKIAWRNSNRCIGRLFWQSLTVFDARHLNTPEQYAEAMLTHIRYATNEGRIRPTVTIFRPSKPNKPAPMRILNYQLIRYAGYETNTGVIGDPHSVALTKQCEDLGWVGKQTNFDLLPIVLQQAGESPKWFELPEQEIKQVKLRHPSYDWFADLELQWYGVPLVSNMRLEIGGISYEAAPFNGWYMGTEIGARNLADTDRYNMLPVIADCMGLDMSSLATLWKDRALVELNAAVLHSFKEDGVSIVDHHTAALQFAQFEKREQEQGRNVTGDWTWLIPPVSPATTHIFHKSYDNTNIRPNFFYMDEIN